MMMDKEIMNKPFLSAIQVFYGKRAFATKLQKPFCNFAVEKEYKLKVLQNYGRNETSASL